MLLINVVEVVWCRDYFGCKEIILYFQPARVANLNHGALSPPGGTVPELQVAFERWE